MILIYVFVYLFCDLMVTLNWLV